MQELARHEGRGLSALADIERGEAEHCPGLFIVEADGCLPQILRLDDILHDFILVCTSVDRAFSGRGDLLPVDLVVGQHG